MNEQGRKKESLHLRVEWMKGKRRDGVGERQTMWVQKEMREGEQNRRYHDEGREEDKKGYIHSLLKA